MVDADLDPAGRLDGIEPHLSIIYRSESGDGLLGERFGIGGLLSVSRCWSTPSQDGHYSTGSSPGLPDQFCLDGERLVRNDPIVPSAICSPSLIQAFMLRR